MQGDVLPLAPAAALYDRLFQVTTAGLSALRGSTGGQEWGVGGTALGAAALAQTQRGLAYAATPTFTDNASYVVAMRCLDAAQPASLCVYGGYERAQVTSSAVGGGRGWAAVAGAMLASAAAVALQAA